MRSFIIENAQIIVGVCALIELAVGIAILAFRGRFKTYGAMRICTALLSFGLFYDALIILIGRFIGAGDLLRYLSIPRFILSALLMPMLFPISALAADAGKKLMRIMVLTAVLFMVLGLVHTIFTMLSPVSFAGLLRYASSADTPGWVKGMSGAISTVCVLPLLIFGVYIIAKKRNFAVFLSGVFMLGLTILAPASGNTDLMVFFSMIGEAFMVLFLFIYAQTAREPDAFIPSRR